jgi:Ohr subfamily peroxiredoxin
MSAPKALYTAHVHVEGGREGTAKSSDGKLDVKLGPPKETGGAGAGTNPEQMFAAGYAACFESAVRYVARQQKVAITTSSVESEVGLHPREGGFSLSVGLKVSLPGLDRAVAQKLLDDADKVCPYAHATRGNIPVTITLA